MASSVIIARARVFKGAGEVGDEGADGEDDGDLPDDASTADWPSEHTSSMSGTLSGRLRSVVLFLIFLTKI